MMLTEGLHGGLHR